MRKTYLLFLLAFVAMGSMLFVGGVQHAHAICNDGTVGTGSVTSVSASVSGSTVSATLSGDSPATCENGTYVASGWATAKLVDSAGNVIVNGSCDSIDTAPGYSIGCTISLSGVPSGSYRVKANTHNIFQGQQIDSAPPAYSSYFNVGSSASLSLSVDKTSVPVNTSYYFSLGGSNIKANTGHIVGGSINASGLAVPGTSVASDSQTTSGTYTYQSSAQDNSGNAVSGNSVTVTVTSAAVNGSCTPNTTQNQASYASTATGWDGRPFCDAGTASPSSPAFPSAGGSTSWSCVGSGGGTTASCSASRQASSCTWTPSPSTVCSGVSFTQTDGCGNSQTAVGTMTCNPTFTISPPSATIQVQGTQQYAGYYDPDGPSGPQASQTIGANSISWASTNTGVATISSSGVATGAAAGSTTIRGTYSGITANASLSVQAPTPTFTIAPPSATIQVQGTQQYAGYYDPDGPSGPQASQTIAATSVTWSSTVTSKATIDSSGVATGVAAGSTTIRGTYSGITASAILNVQGASADFSLSVSPMSQNVAQGSSVAYTVSISPLNGFTGTVNLSKSNLTTGLSGAFNPASVSGGSGTSQFTLSAAASAAPGASSFTITGTSGALSHSAQPTINVTTQAPPPPTASDTVPVEVYFCTGPSDSTPGCSTGPGQCTISASPQNILTGMSSTLTWSCTGVSTTTPCSVTAGNGANVWTSSGWDGSSISRPVRPYSTTNYTLECTGGGSNPPPTQIQVNVGFTPILREIIPRW